MDQQVSQTPNEILPDRDIQFTLLCKSPIALSSDSSVEKLGKTVEQGDLVIRLTIGPSVRLVMYDGCGVHEIREHTVPLNNRIVHAAFGAVEQSSTTAFIDAGMPSEWSIIASASGSGALARGTTEMLESAMLSVHSMAIKVCRQREDWREDYEERISRDPQHNKCDPLGTIAWKATTKERVEDMTLIREQFEAARARVTEREWIAVTMDALEYPLLAIATRIKRGKEATRKLIYRTRMKLQGFPPD